MKYPTNIITLRGKEFVFTWIKTDSLENIFPISQVYGICFNDKNEIMIARRDKNNNWQIPGGSPENNETIEETLKREMIEEVDVKIKNIKLLGAQKVYPKGKPKEFGYQIRCVCDVEEILPQTPDPDNGDTWERKFVPKSKITKYVKWGNIGNAMFKDAISLHLSG